MYMYYKKTVLSINMITSFQHWNMLYITFRRWSSPTYVYYRIWIMELESTGGGMKKSIVSIMHVGLASDFILYN